MKYQAFETWKSQFQSLFNNSRLLPCFSDANIRLTFQVALFLRLAFSGFYACILWPHSCSHSCKEWRFNLNFPWVSMLFLNSWMVSVIPCYVTTHPPAIPKQYWRSREAQIEPPLFECEREWAFRIQALVIFVTFPDMHESEFYAIKKITSLIMHAESEDPCAQQR
jgi:hypothetical protein